VVTLLTAPAGTPIDKRAVGFPLAAGVIALVATFLVVNLIKFSVKCVKAGPRLRIEADREGQDSVIATAQDTTIMDWLRQQLGRREFHVRLAAVFGSITQAYPTRDVDVVVQLQPASDRRIRTLGLRLKELGRAVPGMPGNGAGARAGSARPVARARFRCPVTTGRYRAARRAF